MSLFIGVTIDDALLRYDDNLAIAEKYCPDWEIVWFLWGFNCIKISFWQVFKCMTQLTAIVKSIHLVILAIMRPGKSFGLDNP
jgi:hypothetical protein